MAGERFDAVVVGSGPNGLAAAITIAEHGRSVLVLEAADQPGGGLRTEELIEPGFRNDVCASVMALAPLSPFMRRLDLDLVIPAAPFAHPFDDGTAALCESSVEDTARRLGDDGPAYRRLLEPLVARAAELIADAMGPVRLPGHPLLLARFGLPSLLPASALARLWFGGRDARALFAGAAAHSMISLREPLTSGFGLVMLLTAHAGGWPIAAGGSATVANALVDRLRRLGGDVVCGRRVTSLDSLPPHRAALLDLAPRAVVEVAGARLSARYARGLERYRPGPGIFKVDWTLEAPIPWRAPDCARAGTVHVGGTLDEIEAAEGAVAGGSHPDKPFVLLVQPSLFDPTRAPAGRHTAWAYCHVPNGSTVDMTDAIERQVERFAPGFRELVRGRSTWSPARLEAYNPNIVGGDINGGRMDLGQVFTRPAWRVDPYATSNPRIFICSAATPPAGGVHGLCGWYAARSALRSVLAGPRS